MLRFTLGLCTSLLLLTAACQNTQSVNGSSAAEPAATAVPEPEAVTKTQQVLHLKTTDDLPYPIVENFDELAPIFERTDGKTYVVNFWATWCAPCVEELPYFERLAEETADQEVEIVMVSLDFKRDVRGKLLRFIQDRPLNLPVIALTDTNQRVWIDKVDPEWGGAIPITIIYKGDERAFIAEQFSDYDELAEAVNSIQSSN